jgi:hypothetical protein
VSGGEERPVHESMGPARGYSWPPFEPGNTVGRQFEHGNEAALTAGHDSARKVAPLAQAAQAALVEVAPWVAAPAFAGTVASWAWAEGQAMLLRRYLDEHGMLDPDGEERSAVRTLDRVEGRLAKMRDQLGLSPSALSKLLATAAATAQVTGDYASVAAIQAEGRRLLEARSAAGEDGDGQDPSS